MRDGLIKVLLRTFQEARSFLEGWKREVSFDGYCEGAAAVHDVRFTMYGLRFTRREAALINNSPFTIDC
jgi:hypothetical protein